MKHTGEKLPGGFTLLELLVVMLLSTIGLLGIAGLTSGITRGNFFTKNITSATVIAQTHLEEIQRAGYANANSKAGTTQVTMEGVGFSRNTTVEDDSPQTDMKKVSVTVSWNEGAVGPRSVYFNTILTR